tara:strand:- start:29 stop:277 length:249 start_codon:yes stop_codon:yes gene_type:complete
MSFNSLKKALKYRVSYSGTKETDILYKKYFIDDFDNFTENDLIDIQKLFDYYSDNEIYDFLTKKTNTPYEFETIFKKILNEN